MSSDSDAQIPVVVPVHSLLNLVSDLVELFVHGSTNETDVLVQQSLQRAGELFDVDRAYMFQVDRDHGLMSNTHEWCHPGVTPQIDNLQQIPVADFPWWFAQLEADRPINITRLEDIPPEAVNEREIVANQHILSFLVLPLWSAGELKGFVGFDFERYQRLWTTAEIRVLRLLMSIFGQALERLSLDNELERLALHDSLTGVGNRAAYTDSVEIALLQQVGSNRMVAVFYIDIDAFKPVNELYGTEGGNRCLIEIARRLQDVVRPTDTVARLGGDEFVLVIPEVHGKHEVEHFLDRIIAAISKQIEVNAGEYVSLTACIGVRLRTIDDAANDPDLLLRQADEALHQAKRLGWGQVSYFDPEAAKAATFRRSMAQQVRLGILRDEFELYAQPIVSLADGSVSAAELLIRWHHPENGIQAPGLWMPHVENDPVMIELGDFVLHEALGWCSAWQRSGTCQAVHVNIAGPEVYDPDFVDRIRASLRNHSSVDPTGVVLEMLESIAVADLDLVLPKLQQIAEFGVSYALDDFGTGYSSMTHLRQLPVSIVKVDRSFVKDLTEHAQDRAIVSAVVNMSDAFGLKTVAEGVETSAQAALLRELGYGSAQGYFFAKPMPAAELEMWVANNQPNPLPL